MSNKLFEGYRALGFVSNEVPIKIRFIKRRKEHLVVSCIGNVFHTYSCDRLQLLSVSDPHPEDIKCLAVNSRFVFTSSGNVIWCWKRGNELMFKYEKHENPVHLMLPFGLHMISVDTANTVRVWELKSLEDYTVLEFGDFTISCILHPATYLNKILFGSHEGGLQLWNIRQCKLIYTFKGWNSPVIALEQSPAVDVAAVGLANGYIYVHNLKLDKTLMQFHQEYGPVTSLCFRTDGAPILASACPAGHVVLWNLETREMDSELRDAHESAVTGLCFLNNEPLLLTSSPDNSIKMWIFDICDGGGRLLKYQEGHRSPPTNIRFHGSLGKSILSASLDSSLRIFSTVCDQLNKSLGLASYNRKAAKRRGVHRDKRKMPPIIDFTTETTRDEEWDSIACCHKGLGLVTTWSFYKQRMGEHKLLHDRFKTEISLKDTVAQCVTLTACGNFVVIGYTSGHIDRYNIESGIWRGCYGDSNVCVRGVATDALNQQVIAGTQDGMLNFWKFKEGSLLGKLELSSGVDKIEIHRDSNLLGVVLSDNEIVVVDVDSRIISRRLRGHEDKVTDISFSMDSRWIISASMDKSIRTWDIPTGQLINWFLVDSACISLSLSPTSEYLCTCHVDNLGVYLWSNVSLYTHVNLTPLPSYYQPSLVPLPSSSQGKIDSENLLEEEGEETEYSSPEQIQDDLITLSLLPNSRWLNLLNLDLIKKRNKPKERVKKNKSAPFFLPTVAGLQPEFVKDNEEEGSRILTTVPLQPLSEFAKTVANATNKDDFEALLRHLKKSGPSSIDMDIRCLGPDSGGSIDILYKFMDFIEFALRSNADFECVNAYLGLFLKVHYDVLIADSNVCDRLSVLRKSVDDCWSRLEDRLQQIQCLASYMHSAIL